MKTLIECYQTGTFQTERIHEDGFEVALENENNRLQLHLSKIEIENLIDNLKSLLGE